MRAGTGPAWNTAAASCWPCVPARACARAPGFRGI